MKTFKNVIIGIGIAIIIVFAVFFIKSRIDENRNQKTVDRANHVIDSLNKANR